MILLSTTDKSFNFSILISFFRLDLSHNALTELNRNAFPRFLPWNLKIVGIDSNKFNCTYLAKLFETITPQYFNKISNHFNCNYVNEEEIIQKSPKETTTIRPLNVTTVSTTEFAASTVTTATKQSKETITESSNELKTQTSKAIIRTTETAAKKPKLITKLELAQQPKSVQKNEESRKNETTLKNEHTRKASENFSTITEKIEKVESNYLGRNESENPPNVHESLTVKLDSIEKHLLKNVETSNGHENHIKQSMEEHQIRVHNELISIKTQFFAITCLMAIGFSIIVITATWMVIHSRFARNSVATQVTYKRDAIDLCNAVENNNYEVLKFDK